MTLTVKHKDSKFGVGDRVRVVQKVKDGEKSRKQIFEGMVIAIKGRNNQRTFTVRRIGAQQIGIERIFPLNTPSIESIEVVRRGREGARRSKLYFTRGRAKKGIEEIYTRAERKGKKQKKKTSKKKASSKKKKKSSKKKSK